MLVPCIEHREKFPSGTYGAAGELPGMVVMLPRLHVGSKPAGSAGEDRTLTESRVCVSVLVVTSWSHQKHCYMCMIPSYNLVSRRASTGPHNLQPLKLPQQQERPNSYHLPMRLTCWVDTLVEQGAELATPLAAVALEACCHCICGRLTCAARPAPGFAVGVDLRSHKACVGDIAKRCRLLRRK